MEQEMVIQTESKMESKIETIMNRDIESSTYLNTHFNHNIKSDIVMSYYEYT